jgi:hypothetical protein
MDPGVKVDIQPGPNGLHNIFANLGTPGNPSLRDVMTQTGQPVVPPGVPDAEVAVAQQALQHISSVIVGDQSTIGPSDRLHVAKLTSLSVARTRPAGAKGSHFGRLKPIPGLAFVIHFRPRPEFRVVSTEEAAALRAEMRRTHDTAAAAEGRHGRGRGAGGTEAPHGLFDWFDDIGDFVSSVADGVVDVITVVVTAVGDAYEAAVSFIEGTIQGFVDMVIEFASQVSWLLGRRSH